MAAEEMSGERSREAPVEAEPTDEAVVSFVQQGEVDYFRMLVERYEPKLARYGRRFLFDADETKDLLQEVFIKTYTNIHGFDVSRRFSPWIYRIAHNEFVNAIKKKKRDRDIISLFYLDILFPHPVAKETADDVAQRREIKEMLEQFLSNIGARYRDPLVLYYFENMDYKEIAEILRIPVSTVGVRLQRGKLMLRKMVEKKQ